MHLPANPLHWTWLLHWKGGLQQWQYNQLEKVIIILKYNIAWLASDINSIKNVWYKENKMDYNFWYNNYPDKTDIHYINDLQDSSYQ